MATPPTASPRALGRGRHPDRADPGIAAAGSKRYFRAAHGRGACSGPAHRRDPGRARLERARYRWPAPGRRRLRNPLISDSTHPNRTRHVQPRSFETPISSHYKTMNDDSRREHMFKRALFASAIGLFFAAAQAFAQQPIVIKFSHVVAVDTPKGKAAERFKELAEKATGGKVKVEVYPNSQLYKDKEELEALQLGSVQMLAPSLAKFGPLGVKQFEVFDIPYMFPSETFLARVENGPIGQRLMSKLE